MIKLISIVGPTASGKTALGVHLAKKFNGEIISADSRQVFKHMDIGTGKDLKEYGKVKHYCIDIVDPKTNFNLAKYLKHANNSIEKTIKKNKLPLLVGGTGLYINALTENYNLNNQKVDKNYRNFLSQKTKQELQKNVLEICKKNHIKMPLNNSDWNNPYRLIRFIEKNKLGYKKDNKLDKKFDNLIIGIKPEKEIIKEKIKKRLEIRFNKESMIEEVWDLHNKYGVSWKKILSFGLEYSNIGSFLKNNKTYFKNKKLLDPKHLEKSILKNDYLLMKNKLETEIIQFSKKQMTWLNKNKNVVWLSGEKEDIYKDAADLVKKFIKK